MSSLDLRALAAVAEADDLHIAPQRPGGQTGTPTWIWSVRVDDTYKIKYDGSDYLAPMVAPGPRACTVAVIPAG